MRIGIAGLNGLYWPVSIGNGLVGKPGVEFVAVATLGVSEQDIQANLGMTPAAYSAKYRVNLYEQAEEMVTKEKLDTVAIVTRHTEHAAWVERLAKLGVNIYIPKTFTTSGEDADRIVKAEKANHIRVAVGPSARYLPPMVAIQRALDADAIGEPFSLRICHHHGTIDVFGKNDWYRDPLEGGPELSLGWYGIDLALQFMGDRIKSVFARYGNYTSLGSPFMDCGRLVMEMVRGGIASFDMYFCNRLNYPSWQVEILGPKGVISLHRTGEDPGSARVSLETASGYQELPIPEQTPHWERFWVDELASGKELSLTAEYARRVTLISLAGRESAQTGKVVQLI